MYSKLSYTPYKVIPSTYVLCENDQAIPIEVQERMVENVRKENGGGKVVPFDIVERLEAGHSPFISHARELVEFLYRASGV